MNRSLRTGLSAQFARLRMGRAGLLVMGIGLVVALSLHLGVPLPMLPVAPLALAAVFLVLSYPLAGLNFVIAAQYMPLEVGGFTIFQMSGALVAIATLIWFSTTKRGFTIPRIILPMIALILLALYSLSYTRDNGIIIYVVRKIALNLLFCLLLVNLVGTFRKLRQPLLVLVGMGIANSAVAFVQFATGWQKVEQRSRGLLENENALGAVAAMGFVVPFYVFLYSEQRWKRWLSLAVCGVLFFGMVTSISRGAFLSFLACLLFILIREKRHRARLLFFGLLLASAYPLLPEAFYTRFQHIGSDISGTLVISRRVGLSVRGYYNKAGIRIWKSHPWLGVGLSNFGFYFQLPEYNPGLKGSRWLPPHNLYIQALAETGLVGFMVLTWWILQAAFNYWVAEKKASDDEHRVLVRSCEAITLITLVMAFSSGNLADAHLAMVLALSEVCRRSALAAADAPAETPAVRSVPVPGVGTA